MLKTIGGVEVVVGAGHPSAAVAEGSLTLNTDVGDVFLQDGSGNTDWSRGLANGDNPTIGGGTSAAASAAVTVGALGLYQSQYEPAFSAELGSLALCDEGYVFLKVGDSDSDWEVVDAVAGLGVFSGGDDGNPSDLIDYVQINTTANATFWGNMATSVEKLAGCGNTTLFLVAGGYTSTQIVDIEYSYFSHKGTDSDFGDLPVAVTNPSSASVETTGMWAGGSASGGYEDTTSYSTFASKGNSQDWGDLTTAKYRTSGAGNTSRALIAGGYDTANTKVIDYFTWSSAGNAGDFGDLQTASRLGAAAASPTRIIFAEGYVSAAVDVLEYVTVASLGDASDMGDLTVARAGLTGVSSYTRAVFAGGYSYSDVIDYIAIASTPTTNATDFGDLSVARAELAGASNCHGGL
jgi:hypothetical protein